jgi:hypothetical protein
MFSRVYPHCRNTVRYRTVGATMPKCEIDMADYQDENWVALYGLALVELEHAKMSGRIEAAQAAIVARIETLQHMPGLHDDERQAIADALSGIQVLQDEERRYNQDARLTSPARCPRCSRGNTQE